MLSSWYLQLEHWIPEMYYYANDAAQVIWHIFTVVYDIVLLLLQAHLHCSYLFWMLRSTLSEGCVYWPFLGEYVTDTKKDL